MQDVKPKFDRPRVFVDQTKGPHSYVTWYRHLYPAKASGCTLSFCNSCTDQNSAITQNGTASGSSASLPHNASILSFVSHGLGVGSAIRNMIVHAPGVIRD